MDKRSTSIIKTILLTLIAFSSVSLIFYSLRPIIQEKISVNENISTVNFKVIDGSVKINAVSKLINMKVQRQLGKGRIAGFYVAVEDINRKTFSQKVSSNLEEMQTVDVNLDYSKNSLSKPKKILITPILINESSQEINGKNVFTYFIKESDFIGETVTLFGQNETGGNCTGGRTESCYNGPDGTEGIGICRAGNRTCINGTWDYCIGEILPQPANYTNGLDNNCNGIIDSNETNSNNECKNTNIGSNYCELLTSNNCSDGKDSDYDGVSDYNEVYVYQTDPLNPDTDGDGISDGKEIQRGTNPLVKNSLSFQFTKSDGVHTRTANGLAFTDNRGDDLEVTVFSEMGLPETQFPFRKNQQGNTMTNFDIIFESLKYWRATGIKKIAVIGSYEWMQNQGANSYVRRLKDEAERNGIVLVFGTKMTNYLQGQNSWEELFDSNKRSKFEALGEHIVQMAQVSGANEFYIESETIYIDLCGGAYLDGRFNLTDEDIKNYSDNLAAIKSRAPNVKIIFWQPQFYVDDVAPRSQRYCYSTLFNATFSVFQNNFAFAGDYYPDFYVSYQQKNIPYRNKNGENMPLLLQTLNERGINDYRQITYQYKMFREENSLTEPGKRLWRGSAEHVLDIPYFLGNGLDNSNFRGLKFNNVILDISASQSDLVAQSISDYISNGIMFNVIPKDEIPTGRQINIVISDYMSPGNLCFNVDSSMLCTNGSQPVFKVFSNKKAAVLSWTPGANCGGDTYYWPKFTISDNRGMNVTRVIPIKVI